MKQKVWKVQLITADGNETVFVYAARSAQAVRFVIDRQVKVSEATYADVLAAGAQGKKIEEV